MLAFLSSTLLFTCRPGIPQATRTPSTQEISPGYQRCTDTLMPVLQLMSGTRWTSALCSTQHTSQPVRILVFCLSTSDWPAQQHSNIWHLDCLLLCYEQRQIHFCQFCCIVCHHVANGCAVHAVETDLCLFQCQSHTALYSFTCIDSRIEKVWQC